MSLLAENLAEMKRRASVARTETTSEPEEDHKRIFSKQSTEKDRNYLDLVNQPIKLLPVSQLPRRHSSATPQPAHTQPNQVGFFET